MALWPPAYLQVFYYQNDLNRITVDKSTLSMSLMDALNSANSIKELTV